MIKFRLKLGSLRAKMACTILGAVVAGAAVFLLGMMLVEHWINNVYLSESALMARTDAVAEEFCDYVQQERVSSKDSKRIRQWTQSQGDLYLLLFKNGHVVFEAGWWNETEGEEITDTPLNPDYAYDVAFTDEVCQVVFYDFSEATLYDIWTVVMGVLAYLMVSLIILGYMWRITKRIRLLSAQVCQNSVSENVQQLDTSGSDEISVLAKNINQMQQSLEERLHEEQTAWQANNDLLTAISHDLRTPLTSLMGYLSLADGKQYQSQEQLEQYISVCYQKTLQLKALTDTLFRYFLVYGKRDLVLNFQIYDAATLLSQLLGEAVVDLRDRNYQIVSVPMQQSCMIRVDVEYLKRVMDNLISNLKKYADKARPIIVRAECDEQWLHVYVANHIAVQKEKAESSKIGLKSCSKIMELLHGTFQTVEEDGHYTVHLMLPRYVHKK